MRFWNFVWMVVMVAIIAGCKAAPTPAPESGQLVLTGVRFFPGHSIVFDGTSQLDGEACLLSRLSEDGKELDWWSTGDCQYARDGKINILIPLVDGGTVRELSAEHKYTFRVWQRGDEGVTSGDFNFDIAVP